MKKAEIKTFYDNFGEKQDWQGFYENAAIENLIKHSDFQNAESVFEFGCGTGKFAKDLLDTYLSEDCQYVGIDLSETMINLANKRLIKFNPRAKLQLSDGSVEIGFPANSFDRFVSNYVLDILSLDEIENLFSEAKRVLRNGGLLSITSLTFGKSFVSRQVSNIWEKVHKIRPQLVGGCRPLSLIEFVDESLCEIKHHKEVSSFGIASEILIVENK